MNQPRPVTYRAFLWDVLICSLGGYGGPEAHFGVFSAHMVQRRGYLTQAELAELIALTVLLPGPSSTQTIAAIGYKVGGTRLSLLTLLAVGSLLVLAVTVALLLWRKIPAPVIVLGVMILGFAL